MIGDAFVADSNSARGALVLELRRAGVSELNLLRAIETVPRENFLPHALRDLAGRNCPLPIGCGQTMHAPGLLAAMLSALKLEPNHRVMEIGAGAGYATAVLSRLCAQVVSCERFASLADEARARLKALGFDNARVDCADGFEDPHRHGRFDRIIIHATLGAPPDDLMGALAGSGSLVCGLEGRDGERLAIFSPGVVQRLTPCRLGKPLRGVAKVL